MLIDDISTNRLVGKLILEQMGHQVSLYESGDEAISALSETELRDSTDLILMDIQMPGMDGIMATKLIRLQEKEMNISRPLPIVACTAHATAEEKERFQIAAFDGYVTKPLMVDELLKLIDTVSEKHGFQKLSALTKNPDEPRETSTEQSALPIIAHQVLLAKFLGDHHIAKEVADTVLLELPELVNRLVRAVDNKQAEDIRRAAHALRGSLANVEARRAHRLATEIEECGLFPTV